MKRLSLPTLLIIFALLLSSCSLHLGLSQLLGNGSNAKNSSKHVKVTGTPSVPSGSPSPGSTNAQATALSVGHGNSIAMSSTGFQPNVLKVKKGRSVTWTNTGAVPQDITSDPSGLFDSGLLNGGAVYTFTFASAGIYKYHSTTIPGLNGAVIIP